VVLNAARESGVVFAEVGTGVLVFACFELLLGFPEHLLNVEVGVDPALEALEQNVDDEAAHELEEVDACEHEDDLFFAAVAQDVGVAELEVEQHHKHVQQLGHRVCVTDREERHQLLVLVLILLQVHELGVLDLGVLIQQPPHQQAFDQLEEFVDHIDQQVVEEVVDFQKYTYVYHGQTHAEGLDLVELLEVAEQ